MTNILSIAGFDLFLDVGIKSDIKIANLLKKDIFNISSCNTIQSQDSFTINYQDSHFLEQQINYFLSKNGDKFIKIGMLGNLKNAQIINSCLKNNDKKIQIIFDPIIKSSTGIELMDLKTLNYINNNNFLKNINLITPNINEAEILSDIKIHNLEDVKNAAKIIKSKGVKNVLIKGAHLNVKHKIIEHYLLQEDNKGIIIKNNRIDLVKNIRGTGCMLSMAICCFLDGGLSIFDAVKKSDDFVNKYLQNFQE